MKWGNQNMLRRDLLAITVSVVSAICLVVIIVAICVNNKNDNNVAKINVVSREDGSGTRDAFTQLFGVLDEDKNDATVLSAEITNTTGVMMLTVSNNKSAIGYISLGSLNDTVKAIKIDSVAPTPENVKNSSYKISRPFNIVISESVSDIAQDFINFIMSENGQKIIENNDYISQGNTGAFNGGNVSGSIKITGSSSVAPVMEKLSEAYNEINPNVTIDILQSDSSTGIQDTIDGNNDFGIASRNLKENEKGVESMAIALDGIAIVLNKDNSVNSLTSEQVKNIYNGKITDWSELN
jgi:phosphate transport system substrate-binding protein